MKKTITMILTAAAVLLSGAATSARDGLPKTDEFRGHWYIQVQGGVGQTVGETSFGSLISPSAAFNFGYRFTPVWGLRAGLSGWQGKGAVLGPTEVYRYSYLQGSVDVMADICGIFSGYRAGRSLSPYLFAGVGVNGGFNNSEANSLSGRFPEDNLLWTGRSILPAGRFGLGTGIRITDAVHFNVEVNANILGDRFNSKRGSAVDWQLGALAGFTFNIGLKKGRKAEPVPSSAPVPVAVQMPEPSEPSEPSRPGAAEPSSESVDSAESGEPSSAESAPQFNPVQEDIYFSIGKSVIRPGEKTKLAEVVSLLESYPEAVITVTGHADRATGSAGRNLELSKERARNVAAALMDGGVSGDRITVLYKGDTENPYSEPERNRVAICIVSASGEKE